MTQKQYEEELKRLKQAKSYALNVSDIMGPEYWSQVKPLCDISGTIERILQQSNDNEDKNKEKISSFPKRMHYLSDSKDREVRILAIELKETQEKLEFLEQEAKSVQEKESS
jgi:hypothetical protein